MGNYDLLFTADFNHDGNTDIIGRKPTGELYLYRSNGTGGWQNGSAPDNIGTSGFKNFNILFSPGDFDGDGVDDMIIRKTSTGELFLFRGNGANSWLNPSSPTYIGSAGFGAYNLVF
jgi:hypothetical protein